MNLLKALYGLNKRYLVDYFSSAKDKKAAHKYISTILESGKEVKVEIGAGSKRSADWVTIDNNDNCDINWDLRDGIPFPDGSVSVVYSSHFLEHLTYREGQQMLSECKRVLKPGGTILICVPDSKMYIESYMKDDVAAMKEHSLAHTAWNDTTKMDLLNYMAYMDGHHKYMFDEENLLKVLSKAGFRNAKIRIFNPELDMQTRDFGSIYAEANA